MQEASKSRLDASEEISSTLSTEPENLDLASQPFVGQWNRLISTTNWEKGRIIHQWRETLIATGAAASEYSDDAWARRVGGVTGQHVGRLRRVSDRFGNVCGQYEGLYWSHFHAALDWDDAELWLEGAVQSRWSVSQMRRQRWEAMGALPDQQPSDGDIVVAETDEDHDPALDRDDAVARRTRDSGEPGGPLHEGPDFGEEPHLSGGVDDQGPSILADDSPDKSIQFVRPFENLAELPEDLAEAFETFKLAILRHKTDDWSQISRDDVLAALDALKELTLAPSLD